MASPTLRKRNFFQPWERVVHVLRMPRQDAIGLHRHDFFEVAVVVSGTAIHAVEGFQHRVEGGDVLLIDLNQKHAYRQPRNLNLINLLFRKDFVSRIKRRLRGTSRFPQLFGGSDVRGAYLSRVQLDAGALQRIEQLVEQIEEENAHPTPEGELAVEAWAMLILVTLLRQRPEDLPVNRDGMPAAGFARMQTWLEKNLAAPVSVGGLAAKAGMSERTFYRVFRKQMGLSPLDWVRRARLHRAAVLLRDQRELRIGEIAAQCGFEDEAYFSRSFAQCFGKSPRAYRDRPE